VDEVSRRALLFAARRLQHEPIAVVFALRAGTAAADEVRGLINVPIGLVTFLLTTRFVGESRMPGRPGFDALGAVTVTAGPLLLVYAIVKAEQFGWGSARILLLGAGAAVLIGLFVLVELRRREPLIQLGIFRIRSLAVANATVLFLASAMFPLFFFGSLYLQGVKGFSPIESGIGFLPFTASVLAGAGLAQRSLPRFGARAVSMFGLALAAAALVYLTRLEPGTAYAGGFVPGLAAMGFGIGNAWLPMTMAATGQVDPEQRGLASGLVNTSQQIGGALGLAILTTIASDRTGSILAGAAEPTSPATRADAVVEGFTSAFAVGGGLMLAAVVVLSVWFRRGDVDVGEVETAEPMPGRPAEVGAHA
jgi:MFS transporter